MLDQSKIEYKQVDLDTINRSQLVKVEKSKPDKKFKLDILYNIFNKRFKFKIIFEWRF